MIAVVAFVIGIGATIGTNRVLASAPTPVATQDPQLTALLKGISVDGSGNVTILGKLTTTHFLYANNGAGVLGPFSANNGITVNGGGLTTAGGLTAAGGLTVMNGLTVNSGGVAVNGAFTANNGLKVNGNLAVVGAATINGKSIP
jgi:hypothetical protein